MPNPEKAELHNLVSGLLAATRKGTFRWKAANPSTYVWERAKSPVSPGARITLQRVDQLAIKRGSTGFPEPSKKAIFILQVYEISYVVIGEGVLKLTVTGADDGLLNEKLNELYELISSGYSEEGVDFLKSLISER